jgi:hypothetical protein
MSKLHRTARIVAALAVGLTFALPALAGPPLICHPFVTGTAPVLPWTPGQNWNSPDLSYDVGNLAADTLALLSPDAPVLARMENMRRATIYAAKDPRIGAELLRAVVARAEAADAPPLAWFDAGYLVETYRQYGVVVHEFRMLPKPQDYVPLLSGADVGLDGYALVRKAATLDPELAPEVEFAASLMVRDNSVGEQHRRRAAAGATAGSLLAHNLERF